MSEVARFYKYKILLSGRQAVSAAYLQAELEISPATFKRDIAKLRDQLNMPIVFDRVQGGYRMELGHPDRELPGLWFSHEELLALLTMQQLLSQFEPAVLAPILKPIQGRLVQLLKEDGSASKDISQKILFLPARKRMISAKHFEAVASAVMSGMRMHIVYYNRYRQTNIEREVSPLRLVHYRDNWYLAAWCHLRDGLRNFSVDAIEQIKLLGVASKVVPKETLDAEMTASYGILSGAPNAWATLKFTPLRSQWVSREVWHPLQKSTIDADGSFILSLPYAQDHELIGDIMRYGPDVEVLSPPALKAKVLKTFLATMARYI